MYGHLVVFLPIPSPPSSPSFIFPHLRALQAQTGMKVTEGPGRPGGTQLGKVGSHNASTDTWTGVLVGVRDAVRPPLDLRSLRGSLGPRADIWQETGPLGLKLG